MHALNVLPLVFALLSGPGAGSLLNRISTLLLGFSAPESVNVGCKLDPDGECAPAPTQEVGCKLDPHGQCASSPTQDVGCKLDPSGQCAPAPSPSVGCKLDPNGNPVCYSSPG
jgi:hypothetical protein